MRYLEVPYSWFVGKHCNHIKIKHLYEATNLFKTPGFEIGDKNFPKDWKKYIWKDDSNLVQVRLENNNTKSGKRCVSITCVGENDARVGHVIKVKRKRNYLISCWAKTENVGNEGCGANICILNQIITSDSIKGTIIDWKRLSIYVLVDKYIEEFIVTFGLDEYASINTGKAWFDDVEIRRLNKIPKNSKILIWLMNSEILVYFLLDIGELSMIKLHLLYVHVAILR